MPGWIPYPDTVHQPDQRGRARVPRKAHRSERNGIYYLVYGASAEEGHLSFILWAALRPFEKKGVIIDNTGCDPETWNNHGSIAEFSSGSVLPPLHKRATSAGEHA